MSDHTLNSILSMLHSTCIIAKDSKLEEYSWTVFYRKVLCPFSLDIGCVSLFYSCVKFFSIVNAFFLLIGAVVA